MSKRRVPTWRRSSLDACVQYFLLTYAPTSPLMRACESERGIKSVSSSRRCDPVKGGALARLIAAFAADTHHRLLRARNRLRGVELLQREAGVALGSRLVVQVQITGLRVRATGSVSRSPYMVRSCPFFVYTTIPPSPMRRHGRSRFARIRLENGFGDRFRES